MCVCAGTVAKAYHPPGVPFDDSGYLGADLLALNSPFRYQTISSMLKGDISLSGGCTASPQPQSLPSSTTIRLIKRHLAHDCFAAKSSCDCSSMASAPHGVCVDRFSVHAFCAGPHAQFKDGSGSLIAAYSLSVRIPNVTNPNETWGYPRDFTACPPGACYNPQTRTKAWGSVSLSLDMRATFAQSQGISSLRQQGYSVLLTRPGAAMIGEPVNVPLYKSDNDSTPPDHAVQVVVKAADQQVRTDTHFCICVCVCVCV